ncbi:MAG: cytochrome P450 [Pseudomonadota bacterium]
MAITEADIDLFGDDTLLNTERAYKHLRDTGAIVFLPHNDLFAVTRFDAVRLALRSDRSLVSSRGVAANDMINGKGGNATLTSDGDTHLRRRSVLMRPLTPPALADVKQRINETADRLVRDLVSRDSFCGIKDFASHLPLTIVAELVGLEEAGRENMLEWAAATFDALGPENDRTMNALGLALGLFEYVHQLRPERLKPDGWAAAVFRELETGNISAEEAAGMIIDYTAPSLDTTILATGHMLWRLATTPGAFDALKANPDLIPSMVLESVRLASPIREFTRFAETDYETEHGTIPAGSRVAMLYASANWDERHYDGADEFRIDRNPRDHVGWGHGPHVCAGMHLARMEMEALARALVGQVSAIETDAPVPILNNVLQGFGALPTRLTPAIS